MNSADFRPIFLVNGILLFVLAWVMLLPALADWTAGNPDWIVFFKSSMITGFIGGALYLTNKGYTQTLKLRQAFIFTTSCYLMVGIFASIPFFLAKLSLSPVDSFFETVSGITSTGASVITNLDDMPPGILLWRALLNGLGGVGIVVLTLAILPMLQIGGMQLFRTESSDKADKMLPRVTQVAFVTVSVFALLTVICAILYWLAGMSGFDAICHALSTLSTGGFSTHGNSIEYFKSSMIEYITIFFMISGALPLMLYFRIMQGNLAIFRDTQVRFFFGVVIFVTIIIMTWLIYSKQYGFFDALRLALFNVVSIVTTTGYSSTDYTVWGNFVIPIFFMLIVVGGCTGSTSGGIKIFRFQVLYELAKMQINRLLSPHGVFVPLYNGKPVSESAASSVMGFFLLFAFCFMVLSVALSFFDLDFITSMSAAAQALANVGPGLGDIIGPAGNYKSIPDGAKWLLTFAMIMGRVELFTVIILFTPRFWRG